VAICFCPSCGERLPEDGSIKYCGYCGKKLAGQRDSQFTSQDHFTAKADCDRQEIDNYYSVVLKSSSDKGRLTRRLSKVLQRSVVATRMAVEMVPCVVLYKNKIENIKQVIEIFEAEHLHYLVLKGDFNTAVQIEKVIPGFFQLDNDLQYMLSKLPEKLWLGENVRVVVSEAELDEEFGTLVVTDLGLYFFSEDQSERRQGWRIVPYYSLAKAVLWGDVSMSIELVYHEGANETWLRIDNVQQLKVVHDHIRQVLKHNSESRRKAVPGMGNFV